MAVIIGQKELEGYRKLRDLFPNDFILFEFPVVALGKDRSKLLDKLNDNEKPYLDRLRIDLFVVDVNTLEAKLAIEMQSSFHSDDRQIFCDNLKKKIVEGQKIKLIQIWTDEDWLKINVENKVVPDESIVAPTHEEIEASLTNLDCYIKTQPKVSDVRIKIRNIRKMCVEKLKEIKNIEDDDGEEKVCQILNRLDRMESNLLI